MLSLSLRQIKILNYLLQHEISVVDDLLSDIQISERTLQSEIPYLEVNLITGSEELPAALINQERTSAAAAAMEEVRRRLYETVHLDIGKYSEITRAVHTFLFDYLLSDRYRLHTANNEMSDYATLKKIPVSWSLGLQILEIIREVTGIGYRESDVLRLSITLFDTIFSIPNEYERVNVAIVSSNSRATARSFSYRLHASVERRHNVHTDYYSYYEIDTIDFRKYDCLFILDSVERRLENCPIEVFYVEHFLFNQISQRSHFFEKILSRHRIENFLVYQVNNQIEIAIGNEKGDYLDRILDSLRGFGYENKNGRGILTHLLEDNAAFFQMDPFVVCLLWKRGLEHTLFIYDLETPAWINGFCISQIQIVVMDPNDNILAIKQADSYIRRMQNRCIL